MSEDRDTTGAAAQLVDELKLQAWLARAEFQHPSLEHDEVREEVSALANMRDELRLQAHLGKLEARDTLSHLDDLWRRFKHAASRTADEVGEELHEALHHLREATHRLTGTDAE